MSVGSIIFGLVALACFIVPVLYFQGKKKQESKKFIQQFLQLAEQQQLSISTHNSWNNRYAIGMDTQKQQLFYLKKQDNKDVISKIDLAEVEKCSLIKTQRNVGDSIVVDRLALGFSFRSSKQAEKALEFYSREVSMSINDELQLAEKWKGLINSALPLKASVN